MHSDSGIMQSASCVQVLMRKGYEMRCCKEALKWLVALHKQLEKHSERQKLKRPHCFYLVECQYKGWCTLTHRYSYSPFIWARIMKVKAGSRGRTNNCMDYDYSNAGFGIHRCHYGVTGCWKEHSVVFFFFLFTFFFASFQRLRIFLHFLWPCSVSAVCKWFSVWCILRMSRFSLWSLVLQIYGILLYENSLCLCLTLL